MSYNVSYDSLLMRVGNADMRKASQVTMNILNTLQDFPKEIQAMSSAVLFLCLCERFHLRAPDVLSCADAMVKKSGGYSQANFEAVRAYLKNELED